MKGKRILSLALAVVTVVSAGTAVAFAEEAVSGTQQAQAEEAAHTVRHEKHGRKEKNQEPENAIGKDAAKEAALKDAGFTSEQTGKVRSRVSKTEDGTVVYKVRFSADNRYFKYVIDAASGSVLSRTEQSAEEHAAEKEKARAEKAVGAQTSEDGRPAGRTHGKHAKHGAPGAADAADAADASERPAEGRGKGGGTAADAAEQADETLAG